MDTWTTSAASLSTALPGTFTCILGIDKLFVGAHLGQQVAFFNLLVRGFLAQHSLDEVT
jgi:hypothetical protein